MLISLALLDHPPARAQIDSHWTQAGGGSWTDGANWSTNPTFPNNVGENTYRAVIDLPGPAYSVNLATSVVISQLQLSSTSASLRHSGGTLEVIDSAQLTGGTLRLEGGTLVGGTWSVATNRLVVTNNSGNRLDHVAIIGDTSLDLSGARARIVGGLALTGLLTLQGSNATLTFDDTQNFSGGTLRFAANTSGKFVNVPTGRILTLSTSTRVDGGTGDFSGVGTLINDGTIVADVPGQFLTIGLPAFTNRGVAGSEGGGQLRVGATGSVWTNEPTGVVRVNGGTTLLRGNWSNHGQIDLVSGTLNLGGNFTTAGIGNLSRVAGIVQLSGTLDNSNSTLELSDDSTGAMRITGGTIRGGVVNSDSGVGIVVGSGLSTFDGVVVNAPVTITASNGRLNLVNGAVITGPVTMTATEAVLGIPAGAILDDTTYWLSGGSSFPYAPRVSAEGTGTVTLGQSFSLRGGFGELSSGVLGGGHAAIRNLGRLYADTHELLVSAREFANEGLAEAVDSGELFLGDSETVWTNENTGVLRVEAGALIETDGAWQNRGLISVDGGALRLGGNFSLEPEGTIQRNGGTVTLIGALANAGRTIALDAVSGPWIFSSTGTSNPYLGVIGGTISVADPQFAYFGSLAGVFDGVSVHGPVTIHSPEQLTSAKLVSRNGTVFNDGVTVPERGELTLLAPQTVDHSTIRLFGGGLYLTGAALLTLGPNLVVHGANLIRYVGNQGGTLVNRATIIADVLDRELWVDHPNFRNDGVLRSEGGGHLRVNTSNSHSVSNFVNAEGGRIEAIDGLVRIGANSYVGQRWHNEGEIVVENSILQLVGTLTPEQIGHISRIGGEVHVTGILDNQGREWVFGEGSPPWRLDNCRLLGGTIFLSEANFDPASEASVESAELIGDIALGSGGSLSFGADSSFSGRITLRSNAEAHLGGPNWNTPTEILFDAGGVLRIASSTSEVQIPAGMLIHGNCGPQLINGISASGVDRITNYGTVIADTGNINFYTHDAEGFDFRNDSLMRAQGGRRIRFALSTRFLNMVSPTTFSGGRWEVFGNSRIEVPAFAEINESEVLLSGVSATFLPVESIRVNRGEFALANGKFFYSLAEFINEGVLRVGRGCALNVPEAFEQLAVGNTFVSLAGPLVGVQTGQILVDGAAHLAGTVRVTLENNFVPQIGNQFELVVAQGGISGVFSLDLPALPAGSVWSQTTTSTALILRVEAESTPCPGDINGDRQVGLQDLSVMLSVFGSCPGEANYDGAANLVPDNDCITLEDLTVFLSYFGTSCR